MIWLELILMILSILCKYIRQNKKINNVKIK